MPASQSVSEVMDIHHLRSHKRELDMSLMSVVAIGQNALFIMNKLNPSYLPKHIGYKTNVENKGL